jgi:uncharacterized protein YndB with AHSA1/START domain
MSSTDRIEKHVDLKASAARVWRALSDAQEFGSWFGVALDGAFTPGQVLRGKMTVPNYEHLTLSLHVDVVDERAGVLEFRWHPFAIEPNVDYGAEPLTVVRFVLTETATGAHLVITETGFDALPEARRASAFSANSGGWAKQAQRITDYLAKAS